MHSKVVQLVAVDAAAMLHSAKVAGVEPVGHELVFSTSVAK